MSRKGWLLFAAMSVIWGIPYLLIKITVDAGISAPVLALARSAVGAAVLLPLALHRGQRDRALRALRAHWRPVAVFTVCDMVGPYFLLSDAERRLSSSLSGLLVAAVPIIGAVLARLLGDRERLGATRWLGLAAGFAGVAVLAGPHLGGGTAWPVTEVLIVALTYAISPIVAERHLRDVPELPMTAVCLAAAAVAYAPLAALTWPHHMPSARALAAIGALALVCTALAFVLYLKLIAEAGASRAMVITYVNPAVAVVAGAAVLGEPLTLTVGLSFVLILGGSLLATRKPGAPAAQRQEQEQDGGSGQVGDELAYRLALAGVERDLDPGVPPRLGTAQVPHQVHDPVQLVGLEGEYPFVVVQREAGDRVGPDVRVLPRHHAVLGEHPAAVGGVEQVPLVGADERVHAQVASRLLTGQERRDVPLVEFGGPVQRHH
jgi:drug/metabolite transporter (DMT)-like permease